MSAARRQRRLLYETAFDSRVRRDADDLDRLIQQQPAHDGSPTSSFLNRAAERAASRSSFGSTSGSSASSTPTRRPTDVRQAPQRHAPFTPTERRRVTLVRDGSPVVDPVVSQVVDQSFDRKISFNQWDGVSRCSSGRSSSQESMTVEQQPGRKMGRSASRDSLTSQHHRPNQLEELTSGRRDQEELRKSAFRPGVKVTEGSSSKSGGRARSSDPRQDPELKENQEEDPPMASRPSRPRPSSLLSEVRPADNNNLAQQSPENDERCGVLRDYDAPWDLKMRVNASVSVPERLTTVQETPQNKEAAPNVSLPSRPSLDLSRLQPSVGESSRAPRHNLSLNFGCSALGALGEKVDPQVSLEKQGWYHGSISRVEAEGRLRVLKEGSYLVRNSESSKSDYSLSLRSARGFMHMKIVPTSEGRFILGQFSNPFASIPDMVHHYSTHKLPIKGAEHMSLLHPVIDRLL